MTELNLEVQMQALHREINVHDQIKGSILLKDNGLHISSKLPQQTFEKRRLSADIAHIFRYFHKMSGIGELTFKLHGVNLHLKHIPSKKLILTTMTNKIDTPNLTQLMSLYSRAFQKIL